MRARLALLSDDLRNSYWFVPGLISLGAALLAYLAVWVDALVAGRTPEWVAAFLFDGNTDGAAEILGTVASSMITVAGVVFSITIVVLTLASGQFGPRLLDSFMRDRGTQVTLGTFLGGFLYSLLVLRSLQFTETGTTPAVSVSVALAWGVAGVVVLIYYIHHVSIEIQAPSLVATIGRELVGATSRLYPDADELATGRGTGRASVPDEGGRRVEAASSGYVEMVDLDGLVDVAREHDLLVRVDTRPGRFVVVGTPVGRVWPADRLDDELSARIAGAILTGSRRTSVQDIEFPVQQLTEVAVRALSPSVNDPFTAANCVDQLSVGLCRLAGRELPDTALVDEEGRPRVVLSDPVTFGDLVSAAYAPIRQNAGHHVNVHAHLLEALARIAGCVTDPDRVEPLRVEARLVREAARRGIDEPADRAPVEARWAEFQLAVGQAAPSVR